MLLFFCQWRKNRLALTTHSNNLSNINILSTYLMSLLYLNVLSGQFFLGYLKYVFSASDDETSDSWFDPRGRRIISAGCPSCWLSCSEAQIWFIHLINQTCVHEHSTLTCEDPHIVSYCIVLYCIVLYCIVFSFYSTTFVWLLYLLVTFQVTIFHALPV